MPRTVLVTVTYNGVQDWDEFLAGVLGQDDPDWGLVVVDNASRDGIVERLRDVDDPRVRVVLNDDNVGVAAANNQGIRLALEDGAEHVLIINNDTVLPPGLVRSLLACAKEQDAAMVTPVIPYDEDRDRIWYGGGTFLRRAVCATTTRTGASRSPRSARSRSRPGTRPRPACSSRGRCSSASG